MGWNGDDRGWMHTRHDGKLEFEDQEFAGGWGCLFWRRMGNGLGVWVCVWDEQGEEGKRCV